MTSSEQLERALRRAAREPGALPALYRILLRSRVFVLVVAPQGAIPTIWNSKIVAWIRSDEVNVIPCFTTKTQAIRAAESYQHPYEVDIRSLFEANRECGFHLNPNSDFDLQLSSEHVTRLLTHGTISHDVSKFDVGQDITIRKLVEEPVSVTSALTVLFAENANVEQAYLYELEQMIRGTRSVVVAIVAGNYNDSLVHEISTVLIGSYTGILPVDTCFMQPSGMALEAVKRAQILPFYDRSWGGRLIDADARLQ
jgi:hypothetical protein